MRKSLAFSLLLIKTAKGVAMKNALALGALLAVFSLSYSYGDSKPKNAKTTPQEISRVKVGDAVE